MITEVPGRCQPDAIARVPWQTVSPKTSAPVAVWESRSRCVGSLGVFGDCECWRGVVGVAVGWCWGCRNGLEGVWVVSGRVDRNARPWPGVLGLGVGGSECVE